MVSVSTSVSLAHLAEAAEALTKLGDVQQQQHRVNCGVGEEDYKLHNSASESQPEEEGPASLVSDDDDLQQTQQDDDNGNNNNNSSNNSTNQSKEIFPQRLLAILSEPSLTDVISWLPNGRSFVILRPDVLAEDILPKYLPPAEHGRGGTVKYPSFTRKLNRWGFRQITRGPSTGAFQHPLFRRDEPDLCLEMVCQKSRKRSSKSLVDRSPSPPVEAMSSLHKSVSLSSTSSVASSFSPTGALPPKKRRLCSMDGLDTPMQDSGAATTFAPCVSNENVHTTTTTMAEVVVEENAPATTVAAMLQNNVVHTMVKNNADFVASVLRERDEMERLKVAKSLLLKAFLEASSKL